MASDSNEASIDKLDGTSIKRSDIVEQMITYYKEAYEQDLTDVCDLNEGSEMRTLLESISVDLYDLYYQDYELSKQKFVKYATGQFLDLLGCEVHLTRKSSTAAEGQVTFSISSVYGNSVTIPSGTIILHKYNGYSYVLKSNVTIGTGETSAVGNVISKITGQRYNADPNTLTAFANPTGLRNDLKVTNNNSITGGSDAETDTRFRERILLAKRERAYGTITAYQTLLYDIDQVHDVQFVNPTVAFNHYKYKSDGTVEKDSDGEKVHCTDCTRVCYVNADSKPCPDDVLEEVEYQLTLQSNLVIGHEFHVEPADCADIYFYVSLYLEDGVDSVSQADVVDAIKAYMDGGTVQKDADTSRTYPGLNIRESVKKSRLTEAIEYVPGVFQVDHIMRIKYDATLDDNTPWIYDSDDLYHYIDDDGYIYTATEAGTDNGEDIDHWGKKEFTSIDLSSGRVGTFRPMSYADGYVGSSDSTGDPHMIQLYFVQE